MRELLDAIREWRLRRARFAQEWPFHQKRAADELETLGLSPGEARRLAARRLGLRSRYRRAALREVGADLAGLVETLAPPSFERAPVAVPCSLVLLLVVLFAINPGRMQVTRSVADPSDLPREALSLHDKTAGCLPAIPTAAARVSADACAAGAPWLRPVLIPTGFAKFTWGLVVLAGSVLLARGVLRTGTGFRLWLYGSLTLGLLAVLGVSLWATVMQLWSLANWPSRTTQSLYVLLLALAYGWLTLFAAWFWRHDVYSRCPRCLRPLRMPLERGYAHDLLLDPVEVESVCIQGHGSLTESRWRRSFRWGGSFWEDLTKSSAG